MRPLESHEAVEERQLREWGIKINSTREQSYKQGFEDGLETTALLYPVNKNGGRKVIVIDAAGNTIAIVGGKVEDIKELNDRIYIFMESGQRIRLIVSKKEEK
jgi:hypothetical protein